MLTRTDDGVCTTFGYDDVDQLISEFRTGYSASYTYDANGNRASKTLNGVVQTYVTDAGDKLTGIWQGLSQVKTFTYDAAGRTTAITDGGVTTNFSYDYEDRITQITRSGMTTNTLGYNGFGTRVSKTDSGGTFSFMRNGTGVTAPVLSDGFANCTPGVSEKRNGTTRDYSCDRVSQVCQLSASGTVVASKRFDAFGTVASSIGSWSGDLGHGGMFGYRSDADTGLQLLGHRVYDPLLGRFLVRDHKKSGRNWYTYVGNRATHFVDPSGLRVLEIGVDVGAAVGIGGGIGVQVWIDPDDGNFGFGCGGYAEAGGEAGLGASLGVSTYEHAKPTEFSMEGYFGASTPFGGIKAAPDFDSIGCSWGSNRWGLYEGARAGFNFNFKELAGYGKDFANYAWSKMEPSVAGMDQGEDLESPLLVPTNKNIWDAILSFFIKENE